MTTLGFELAFAWRNIWRQGRRSAVAVATVAFGVAALLLAGGFIDWLLVAMREWTIRSQFGHVQVVASGYGSHGAADPFDFLLPEPSELLTRIERQPHVAGIAPRLSFSGLVSHGDATLSFVGQGVMPAKERQLAGAMQITAGDDLAESDSRGIILGQGLARNLGATVGDKVVLMSTPAKGGTNAVECRVRGLFATASKAFDDVALRAPLSTIQSLLRINGSHSWVVFLDRTESTGQVLQKLRSDLAGERVELLPWNELADMFNKTAALFSKQIGVMKVIVAAIIVLSISNTMTMNVIERTGEIGTAMAVGVRRRGLVRIFLLEGLMLGLVGGAVGLAVGAAVAALASAVGIPMPPPPGMARGYTAQISVSAVLARDALFLALGTALAASAYPAWKGSRMNIVDALRHNR